MNKYEKISKCLEDSFRNDGRVSHICINREKFPYGKMQYTAEIFDNKIIMFRFKFK